MRNLVIALFVMAFAAQAADVDPFNTYRWNRKNALRNNGKIDDRPWYEWWYYKIVLPEEEKSFYFVYGVVNPWDHDKSMKGTRSYVGFGDFDHDADTIIDVPIARIPDGGDLYLVLTQLRGSASPDPDGNALANISMPWAIQIANIFG